MASLNNGTNGKAHTGDQAEEPVTAIPPGQTISAGWLRLQYVGIF